MSLSRSGWLCFEFLIFNLFLAAGTKVSAPASMFNFFDSGATGFTVFSSAAINVKIGDEASAGAVAADIIFCRGAFFAD